MTEKQPLFITRVAIENFKNVRVLDVKLNRFLTKVSGANGAGKSSALDAIFYALAPRKTVTPAFLRQGEKQGFLLVETPTHRIMRKLDEYGGNLQIEVKGTGAILTKPTEWLEEIACNMSFDPLHFLTKLDRNERYEALAKLVELPVDVDALEAENERESALITARKAEANRMRPIRDNLRRNIDDALPAEPVDVNALLTEAREIGEHNARIRAERRERESIAFEHKAAIANADAAAKRVEELDTQLERAKAVRDEAINRADSMNKTVSGWKPLEDVKDTSDIEKRIRESSARNADIANNNAAKVSFANLDEQVIEIERELDTLAASVRDRKMQIGRALAEAKFPIPGLGFATEDKGSAKQDLKNPKKYVTYNGLPLEEASTGEQIRVSAAIGMASKKELRFMLIHEGSLLDDEGMAILEAMAHANEYQILCEVVDTSGKVGIFMQEGHVAAVNKEPEPQPVIHFNADEIGGDPKLNPSKRTRKKDSQPKD